MKLNNFLALTAAAFVMTACSPKTETTASSTDTTKTQAETPATPEAKAGATEGQIQTLTGTYTETEEGDYYHALVKGEDGTDWSFFFAPDLDEARSGEMIEGLWNGKKVKVGWRKAERDIQEAGGMMELDEIVSIEAL